jgi:hypothetical protein
MITPEQLCRALTEHDGEEVTDLRQVQKISFSGEELRAFINSLPEHESVSCHTCKHSDKHLEEEPCRNCDGTNLWEEEK